MSPIAKLSLALCLVAAWVCPVLVAADAPPPAKPAVADDLAAKIADAAPAQPAAKPAKPRKLLVFTLVSGFPHSSIPVVSKALEIVGRKTGAYETVVTDDASYFEADKLTEFDAVCMNNTTGEMFTGKKDSPAAPETTERLRKNLLDFVSSGKGLIGIHAATDCSYKWAEYGKMIGGYFASHPYSKIVVRVESPDNPVNAVYRGQAEFEITDEIYTFKDPYSRESMRILLSVEMEKSGLMAKSKRPDGDHALSWIKPYGKGRVYYSAFGHRNEIMHNPAVLAHWLAGIQYSMGDLKADDTPSGKASAPPVPPPPPAKDVKQSLLDMTAGSVLLMAAEPQPAEQPKDQPAPAPYELPAPGKDGWIVLFDGKDLSHWRAKDGGAPHEGWKIEDGAAVRAAKAGDLWSKGRFGDFVLELEFMTEGNSGVFIRTDDTIQWLNTGIEVQVDKPRPDGNPNKHSCGAIYDCLAPAKDLVKAGEWNKYVITCDDNKIAVVLNGEQIIDMDLNQWTEAGKNPDGTKNKFKTAYKDMKREGHIGLQDHGAKISYRNIRVKPIAKK